MNPDSLETQELKQKKTEGATKIDCDQVSALKQSLESFAGLAVLPGQSRRRIYDAGLLAAILEIMKTCKLEFKDRAARHNAISHFTELYSDTDESPA